MSVFGRGLTLIVCLGVAVPNGAAQAQSARGSLASASSASGDLFARDRSVAVLERPHPEYEAVGLPFGTFTAFPRLQIDGEYSDNIYAVSTGAVDDFIVRIKPEISIESGWSRHFFGAYARGSLSRYNDYSSENADEWGVGANGQIDFTRAANITLGVDYASLVEPRSSSNAPTTTVKPVEYDTAQAFLAGTRVSGRLKLSARGDVRSFDYKDGVTAGGFVVDQDNRDRTVSSLTGRVDYAVSPATAWFVSASGNKRAYDVASTPTSAARDSSGYEILAGANFELGAVVRGEVAAGYISQQFDDAAYGTIDGFGARGRLEWFPTQLTTVTATASRTVEDSGIQGSGGYLSSAVGVSVDHELLRNVIVSGQVSYVQDAYDGIDRDDDLLAARASATYLANRRLGVTLAASHTERSSSGADSGVEFTDNRLSVSLVSQF